MLTGGLSIAYRPRFSRSMWQQPKRSFGHRQRGHRRHVRKWAMQPPNEVRAEPLEGCTIAACQRCELAGKLTLLSVDFSSAKWHLDEDQQVVAELLDVVVIELRE